ncbi:MAG: hypothetical protein L3K26_07390, partial [Candidatus Hydrogenedentes bacterium]|nr:hypothetical protein [Candidatus Hydrogenedentota bacterium]
WSEPLYGYYRNADPWVLRRHAHLLADAGVDTLIFDATNRVTYNDVYMPLCEVFSDIRKAGGKTPQIAFMTNTRAGETADELYKDLYGAGKYKELWFHWEGKPLLICDPAQASETVKAFFTLRKAHWPFEMVNTDKAWHWEAAYPQPFGFVDDESNVEQINVSVAQNLRAADGKVTDMSRGDARVRSFHDGAVDTSPGAVLHGHNFQEQWTRAWELDPPFVMVTGWNEWIAGRFKREGLPVAFVDQFDQEGSRDIEMMKGGHGDNYYYQLAAGIRRYKGASALPAPAVPHSIDIAGDWAQWTEATSYGDHLDETTPRDHVGAGKTHYKNDSGRNNFRTLKVAHDAENIYFYAECTTDLTEPSGDNWMNLFIDTDTNAATGWAGYDVRINGAGVHRSVAGSDKDWGWSKTGDVTQRRVSSNILQLAVPRALLGIPTGAFTIDFKWTDNLQNPGDVMDLYLSGDVAPEGRYNYRYSAK